MKCLFPRIIWFLCALLVLTACASGQSVPTSAPRATSQQTARPSAVTTAIRPATPAAGRLYSDAKLGFQLTIPQSWQAQAQPGSQSSPDAAAVTFTNNESSSRAVIVIGVFHGATMPATFAARGTPTTHLGSYPAFVADRLPGEGRAPCLVRLFLAHTDYVVADWCSPTALSYRTQFESVLATYQAAPATFVHGKLALPAVQTCAGMQQELGYTRAPWGQQLATPVAAGWRQAGAGIFVCSNDGSPDWYLFQCTELINRFLYERWALPHLPGNAARYYDYYQDGVLHPGVIHQFPASSYQLSDDASQGHSAWRPVAGDILIFQDVNSPRLGWKSGLVNDPGHVALIVGVDNAFVYLAQENYSDSQYFLALPIQHLANGYQITDRSGWPQRIVRGWIHFTANGGPLPTN